jgi:hypothetical protein
MDFQSLKSQRSSRLSSKPFIGVVSAASNDRHDNPDTAPTETSSRTGPVSENLQDSEGQIPHSAKSPEARDNDEPFSGSLRTETSNWDAVYTTIPPTVRIRVTTETGRGLYSKNAFRPGQWPPQLSLILLSLIF